MSNIIDGIDYGMGYEPTKEWFPGITSISRGGKDWCKSITKHQGELDYQINCGNMFYRRPLPIISQHPGAIPLEPGEELIEGECYLMRDGRLTGPMPYDGHEAFPFGVDGTPDTWRRDGSCWKNSLSRNDIIARLPKVERKDPSFQELKKQADTEIRKILGDPMPEPEPEKAKEEKKMENPNLIDIGAVHYADFHGTPANFRIPIIEASRIAQLPEVIAEVERQRKEREIGEGDWVRHKRDALIFKVQFADDRHKTVLYPNGVYHYGMENLEKIHDPDFIDMLERGQP